MLNFKKQMEVLEQAKDILFNIREELDELTKTSTYIDNPKLRVSLARSNMCISSSLDLSKINIDAEVLKQSKIGSEAAMD